MISISLITLNNTILHLSCPSSHVEHLSVLTNFTEHECKSCKSMAEMQYLFSVPGLSHHHPRGLEINEAKWSFQHSHSVEINEP